MWQQLPARKSAGVASDPRCKGEEQHRDWGEELAQCRNIFFSPLATSGLSTVTYLEQDMKTALGKVE